MSTWSGPMPKHGSNALGWLMGDVNNDGKDEIVQCWSNSKKLGISVFGWGTSGNNGQAVVQKYYNNNCGPNPNNTSIWLMGNIRGNGQTNYSDAIACWSKGTNIVFTGYGVESTSSNINQIWETVTNINNAPAPAYLIGDVNNDGRDEIILCSSYNGNVRISVYAWNAGSLNLLVQTDLANGAGYVRWLIGDIDGDGNAEIIQCWSDGPNLAFIVYGVQPSGVVELARMTLPNVGSYGFQWFIDDMNGDGKAEIVQCWQEGNNLAMTVFGCMDGNYDLKVMGNNLDLGSFNASVTWLIGDVNGDGKAEIVRGWQSGSSLGMTIYGWVVDHMAVRWNNQNMGQGYGAVGWLIGDINGDGMAEVVQEWSKSSSLNTIVYGAFWNCAKVYTAPLTVNQFVSRVTPGNVAVCLSGGGSRALAAGMGQLLALQNIESAGTNLLAQTKMLSTVSGGAWVGTTFCFLPANISDLEFLGGPYILPASLNLTNLGTLPDNCIGKRVGTYFTIEDIALVAAALYLWEDVPSNMLWQTVIGAYLLGHYKLFSTFSDQLAPSGFFSYSKATVQEIIGYDPSNQSMASEPVNLVTNAQRPFVVCNMSMAGYWNGGSSVGLVPVQSTPFFTGSVGTSSYEDTNGRIVGNGGLTSFAFSSTPTSRKDDLVSISQIRHWTLVDCIGTSSCAFAGPMIQGMTALFEDPQLFAHRIREAKPRLLEMAADRDELELRIDAFLADPEMELSKRSLLFTEALVPKYKYWPSNMITYPTDVNPSLFADGGNLENLGVASALSYSDISKIVACINAPNPLKRDASSCTIIDDAVPPLFGFQPYDPDRGYVPYSDGIINSKYLFMAGNQVFTSASFQIMLDSLWAQAINGRAVYTFQQVDTVDNAFFGVVGGRTISVLWVYLQPTDNWFNQLPLNVQSKVNSLSDLPMQFPNYPTEITQLDPTEVNLLANLTAWTLLEAKEQLLSLYQ